MHDLIPLSLLSPGQSAEVGEVLGPPEQVHRLQELGFRAGAAIEMIQRDSGCVIRLGGQKFGFRADELLHVLVRRGAVA